MFRVEPHQSLPARQVELGEIHGRVVSEVPAVVDVPFVRTCRLQVKGVSAIFRVGPPYVDYPCSNLIVRAYPGVL